MLEKLNFKTCETQAFVNKPKTSKRWIEAGYELFASEGLGGIHVERLARIVGLNKSGFYHYFNDMDNFSGQLIHHHFTAFDIFLEDVHQCQNIDPEYIKVLIKHKITIMGQIHLVRDRGSRLLNGTHKTLDDKIDHAIQRVWADYIQMPDNPILALEYHRLIRDVFYSRVNPENFNYEYLHNLAEEAKGMVSKMIGEKTIV